MKQLIFGIAALSLWAGCAVAQESVLKCEMQTTFRKPWFGNTEWEHKEKKITKFFKLDDSAKKAYAYNDRRGAYIPICSDKNAACVVKWSDAAISIDATKAADDPVPPHLDFRRTFALSNSGAKAHFTIADYGDSKNGNANMSWNFDGECQKVDAEVRGAPPGAHAATYVDARVMPIGDAERDQLLANRVGNTMTGLSAGGRSWFHMWIFEGGLAYTGDGDDMSSEGTPRHLYLGKEANGAYRMCEQPIPAEGAMGCYPWPNVKLGDRWTEHDLYGDANFELLPGRQ